jgi:hypothetical protein
MTTAINDSVLRAGRDQVFRFGGMLNDDLGSTALATQAGATPLTGMFNRVTTGAATASFLLKSMKNLEAPRLCILVNDGPNSINLYPTVGETMNGVANAVLAVAAGATAFCFMSKISGVQDWRAGVIT